jgi:hypothetical protein
VPTLIRVVVVAGHLQEDLQRLLESLEPLCGRRERQAEADRLVLVPRGTDAEPRPAAGEHVERRDALGE